MTLFALFALTLPLVTYARADVTYKTTHRFTGGMIAQVPVFVDYRLVLTHYLKGQKMVIANERVVEILDFDAHTVTYVYKADKKYMVRNFSDSNADAGTIAEKANADARETGQKKIVNGFMAGELLMTLEMLHPVPRPTEKTEIDMWFSPGVPGAAELRDFYRKNTGIFPWVAVGRIYVGIPLLLPAAVETFLSCFDWSECGGNPGIQAAVAKLQAYISSMEGVPVKQTISVTARPSAYAASLQARLPAVRSSLIETTMDSSDFATGDISDSVFAIPSDYKEGAPEPHAFVPPIISGASPNRFSAGSGSGVDSGPGAGGGVGGAVFRARGGVSPPSLISRVDPEFTDEARAAKFSRMVLLSVIVDTEGKARDIHVVKGLGMGLDENAVAAVLKWKFKPGMKDGAPVNVRAQIQVNFRFQNGQTP